MIKKKKKKKKKNNIHSSNHATKYYPDERYKTIALLFSDFMVSNRYLDSNSYPNFWGKHNDTMNLNAEEKIIF